LALLIFHNDCNECPGKSAEMLERVRGGGRIEEKEERRKRESARRRNEKPLFSAERDHLLGLVEIFN